MIEAVQIIILRFSRFSLKVTPLENGNAWPTNAENLGNERIEPIAFRNGRTSKHPTHMSRFTDGQNVQKSRQSYRSRRWNWDSYRILSILLSAFCQFSRKTYESTCSQKIFGTSKNNLLCAEIFFMTIGPLFLKSRMSFLQLQAVKHEFRVVLDRKSISPVRVLSIFQKKLRVGMIPNFFWVE